MIAFDMLPKAIFLSMLFPMNFFHGYSHIVNLLIVPFDV